MKNKNIFLNFLLITFWWRAIAAVRLFRLKIFGYKSWTDLGSRGKYVKFLKRLKKTYFPFVTSIIITGTLSSEIHCAKFSIRWPVLVSAILVSWRISKLILTNFSNIHTKEVQFPWTFLIRTHDSPRMNIFRWSTFQNVAKNVFAPNFSYAQRNIILNIGEI